MNNKQIDSFLRGVMTQDYLQAKEALESIVSEKMMQRVKTEQSNLNKRNK